MILLNPELYAAYVHHSDLGQTIPDLPRVDTTRMVTVKVNDRSGQPIPFADVTITVRTAIASLWRPRPTGRLCFFLGLTG